MCSRRVISGYLESEIAPKSQKVIQKNHLKEKLSQKRSGKILHGGFLHSQLSPVRADSIFLSYQGMHPSIVLQNHCHQQPLLGPIPRNLFLILSAVASSP